VNVHGLWILNSKGFSNENIEGTGLYNN